MAVCRRAAAKFSQLPRSVKYVTCLTAVGGAAFFYANLNTLAANTLDSNGRTRLDPYRTASTAELQSSAARLSEQPGTWTFQTGAMVIPHPTKANMQADPFNQYNMTSQGAGEDSFFIEPTVLGVADGVGGWAEMGVSSALYSRMLMHYCQHAALDDKTGCPLDARTILQQGHSTMPGTIDGKPFYGSTTALIATIKGGVVSTANLGDSGFLHIRAGKAIRRGRQGQHQFNFPFQLSHVNQSPLRDSPADAIVERARVQQGDILVLATDGMFDNLFNDDVANVIVAATTAGHSVTKMAELVAKEAQARAKEDRESPFYLEAKAANIAHLLPDKGKVDDICVLVAKVQLDAGGAECRKTLSKL